MVSVLGLDIGTTWAGAFDGPNGKPAFLSDYGRMPADDDFGPLFGKFSGWLRDVIALQRPALMGCEAPWISFSASEEDRPTPLKIAYLLLGMTAVAETVADAHRVPFRKCQIASVRKTFTGNGHAKKPEVRDRCVRLGWRVHNLHESDAGALYAHLKMQVDRTFVLPPPGMLWANARVTA